MYLLRKVVLNLNYFSTAQGWIAVLVLSVSKKEAGKVGEY